MQDQIDELRGQIEELPSRIEALEQSQAQEVGPTDYEPIEIAKGTVVFRSTIKPYRYVCANCHGKETISALQQIPDVMARAFFRGPGVKCATCDWMGAGRLP